MDSPDGPDTRDGQFTANRPLLFAIAYRMVGTVMDAEDLVQDAYLRWVEAPETDIRVPAAYLTTIITRLAINFLGSARNRREEYVGPWLPEPLVTDPSPNAEASVELAESLSLAFLVLLERLAPVERAVFLLHDVFDLEYDEIARIVEKTETNCRQILSRARERVSAERPRFDADTERAEALVERFNQAAGNGDLDGLVAMLAEDITLWVDGGGKAKGALPKPVHGSTPVAKVVINTMKRLAPEGIVFRMARLNGRPGLIAYGAGVAQSAVIFEMGADRIENIYVVANPDKLQGIRKSAAK
ncbi:MAG TPA: RNA polymerase sigma-70 factor [Gemmatimonadales bacterium]